MGKTYLINEGQSKINDNIKDFCANIPDINRIQDLVLLDKYFYKYFKRDNSTPKFSRTVIEIFESKTFSGCSDIGMMVAAILREKQIPTIYVETANVDWLNKQLNDLPGHEIMLGHIFLEIFIEGKWVLYDPTFHIVYCNYDKTNNNYPRRYYVFAKGMDANSLGVFNTKDERLLAIKKLKDYDYQTYAEPMYQELDLKGLLI